MKIEQSASTGTVPVDDTALYVTDTGGPGRPVVYLNGAYADQSHWRRVIADLGSDYRHITYDERARGKSERSGDYSFDAFPVGVTGEEGRERIRKLFRRMRLLFPIAARLGLAARMTADQHADVNIELNEIAAASVLVLDRLTCPVRFVLATGKSLGTRDGEMEQGRTTLDPVLARNPSLKVSTKVASNHSNILRNDSPAVAQAVRETAAAYDRKSAESMADGLTVGQATATETCFTNL
jgi:pimeloyl-ACP methyl ester carboxylesterase